MNKTFPMIKKSASMPVDANWDRSCKIGVQADLDMIVNVIKENTVRKVDNWCDVLLAIESQAANRSDRVFSYVKCCQQVEVNSQ